MRKFYLLPCALLLAGALRAQKDTVFVSHSESTGVLSPSAITDARDEVFKIQEPCRFLLKLNLATLLPLQTRDGAIYRGIFSENSWDVQRLELSGEFKLRPSLSVDAGIQTTLRNQGNWLTSLTARVEPRWYYGMSRKIKKGTQADNLSGNYLSVEFAHTRYKSVTQGNVNSLLINWGAQRRLFNMGYFDLGFGAGMAWISNGPFSRGGRILYARPRAAVGLALARRQSVKSAGSYCDVLRCFVEERRMWKVDLFTLVDFYVDYRTRVIALNPKIAFEQKIAASAWSVQTEVGGSLYSGKYAVETFNEKQHFTSQVYQTAVSLQPRWYYNLKRRIAQGKSGNSLSGMYVALQGRWSYGYEPASNIQAGAERSVQHWSLAPVWGLQHRFMRHGYADFNIGAGLASQRFGIVNSNGDKVTWKEGGLIYLAGGLRVGLAF